MVMTPRDIRAKYAPSHREVIRFAKEHNRDFTNGMVTKRIRHRLIQEKIRAELGRSYTIQDTAADWTVVYGFARIGGVFTFVHVTDNNAKLHLYITLAAHEINMIETMYLDNDEVVFGDSPDPRWSTSLVSENFVFQNALRKIFMAPVLGTEDQPVQPDLNANAGPVWGVNCRQRGRAGAYVQLVWNPLVFPDGIPDISFAVQGKKCFDPRDDTTDYTENAALIIADYLMDTSYGVGVPLSKIFIGDADTPGSLWWAADKCGELLTTQSGVLRQRYSINGHFDTTEEPSKIIEMMCGAMSGNITFTNGTWKFWPGVFVDTDVVLTEDDILSPIHVETKITKRDSFNAVKGTYVNAGRGFIEESFPTVTNAFYKAQDNNELVFTDIQLPFTRFPSTAQRIAKLEMERSRQSITVEMLTTLKGYQCEPNEVLRLTLSRLGWIEKAFEVEESELVVESDENGNPYVACRLVLRETASAVFDWNEGSETTEDIALNSTLPDIRSVSPPTGIVAESGTDQLDVRSDGTVFSRIKVSWTHMPDFFVSSGGDIEVQYKKSADSDWRKTPTVNGDQDMLFILDVADTVQYDIRVRSINAARIASDWSSTIQHIVAGKTEPPSDVTGASAQFTPFGVRIFWNAIPDKDLGSYEIRITSLDGAWEGAQEIAKDLKTTNFLYDVKLTGTYKFLIKAVDTSGNYSLNAATVTANVTPPTKVQLTSSISGPNLILNWTESEALFSINTYEVYQGSIFATATLIASVKGTSYSSKVTWSGIQTFWVIARDAAGNAGVENFVVVEITAPSFVQELTTQVIGNNVLVRWKQPTFHTLPIDYYQIYRGAVFISALQVGRAQGTFVNLFESQAGTYTYWVVAIDTAGNVGAEKGIATTVSQPPNYVLLRDQILEPNDGSGTNVIIEDDILRNPQVTVAPIELTTVQIANPNMGLQTTQNTIAFKTAAGQNPLNLPSESEVYRMFMPLIETAANTFTYTEVDSMIRNARAAGQRINFRVICYDEANTPYANTSTPVNYLQRYPGANCFPYFDAVDGTVVNSCAPDFDNLVVQARVINFFNQLAAHPVDGIPFADHPNLGHIDIGVWGHAGEWHHSDCHIHPRATRTMGTGNSKLRLWARAPGTAGNSKTCDIVVSGTGTSLSVNVTSSNVTINSATNGGGSATSTVNQIITALYAVGTTFTNDWTADSADGTGAGTIAAASSASLAGGSATLQGAEMPLPSLASMQTLIDAVFAAFPNKKKLGILDKKNVAVLQYLCISKSGEKGGYRADGIGFPVFQGTMYVNLDTDVPLVDVWKVAPVFGEPYLWLSQHGIPPQINDSSTWTGRGWDVDAILTSWEQRHCSAFNSKGDLTLNSTAPRFLQYLLKMGYRHVLTSMKHPIKVKTGVSFTLKTDWTNRGVAKNYDGHVLAIRLSANGVGDCILPTSEVMDMEPGTESFLHTFTAPTWLPDGTYTVSVGEVNPTTLRPEVTLAIQGKESSTRWYPLSSIQVQNTSPTFSPKRYGGLKAYWTTQDATTIIKTKADGTQAVADDFVEQWKDSSGFNNHWEQLTVGSKPQLKASTINSLPGLLFDGSNDFFQGSLQTRQILSNVSKLYLFMVMRTLTVNPSQSIIAQWAQTSPTGKTILRLLESGSPAAYQIGGRRLGADTFASSTSSATHGSNVTELRTLKFDWSNKSAALWINGSNSAPVIDVASFFATAGNTEDIAFLLMTLGAHSDATTDFHNMYMCEMAIYTASSMSDPFPSATDISAIEAGLALPYGITLA